MHLRISLISKISIIISVLSLPLLLILELSFQICFGFRHDSLKDIPSIFPSRLNYAGLKSHKKAWWVKEITPDFHVSGRLTERQLKYAAEAGFKSIVSLFTYPAEDFDTFGSVPLLNTEEEKRVVEDVTGLQFHVVLDPMDEWASVEAVAKFTSLAPKLEKPVLLHCDRGYTITFIVLLYMANQTIHNTNFKPKIHSKEFFEIAAAMGYNFFDRIPLEVVSEITKEPIEKFTDKSVPKPNFQPTEWYDYWLAQPVYQNWFIAGQIYKSHVNLLKDFGYKSVINLRPGIIYKGKPNQEEVTLLNIQDYTGTYGDTHTPPRQSTERLLKTRLNPNLPNSYISKTSEINYETTNEEEFGDNFGYNSDLEKKVFDNQDLKYYHLPYDFDVQLLEFSEVFESNKELFLKIGKDGPVLVHCAIGFRAATVAVLTSAIQYNLTLDWALQRLKELGFGITQDAYPNVYKVYEKYLTLQKTEL
uniref:Rhodanese domain-containing protein n=1 Tax=Biomphalaria glabrata TaxID=6526 RepID=A0A2C9LG27_BIOGL